MEAFFTVLTHTAVAAGLVWKLGLCAYAIFSAHSKIEKMLRSSAFTTGMLVFFGARATGLSLTQLIAEAVKLANPFTFGLAAILAPGLVGVIMAWYVIRTLKRSTDIAIRVMILVGTFTLFQFGDLYAVSLTQQGFHMHRAFVPNIAFTVAVSLYAILRVKTK